MDPALIETVRAHDDGTLPLLEGHLARLKASCAALGYACNGAATRIELLSAAQQAIQVGPLRLRLLTHRLGQRTLEVAPLSPLPTTPAIVLAPTPLDAREVLLRHKTTYRPWYEPATQWLAKHPDIVDWIFINKRGELCEGSRSNLYLRLNGSWVTPPLTSGCLPGVQRAALLGAGRARVRILTLADLQTAQAIRLSNALRGWFDVVLKTFN
jgi:4-amino-4-deoxychorismate lyase